MSLADTIAALDREDDERKARLSRPEALAEAAAWYAAKGIACFPLVVGGKRPAIPKAHPDDDALQHSCKRACGRDGHGLWDATDDLEQVAAWWHRWPQANIGLRTGITFDAIDVDGPLGYRSLADLRDEGLIPEVIGRTITPRGGTHLYIHPTGDGNAAGLRPGIDHRGVGGYVVAPPSVSVETGKRWTWTTPIELS